MKLRQQLIASLRTEWPTLNVAARLTSIRITRMRWRRHLAWLKATKLDI